MTLLPGGHAAKCLGEGVTRQNAWDLPLTLLASGHAAKCLGEGDTRQNAWDLPLTLIPIGHAGKCLEPPLDPISYWSRGKMPGTSQ